MSKSCQTGTPVARLQLTNTPIQLVKRRRVIQESKQVTCSYDDNSDASIATKASDSVMPIRRKKPSQKGTQVPSSKGSAMISRRTLASRFGNLDSLTSKPIPEDLLDFAGMAKLVPVDGPVKREDDYFIMDITTQRGIQTRKISDTETRMRLRRLRQSDLWAQLVRDGTAFVRRCESHE